MKVKDILLVPKGLLRGAVCIIACSLLPATYSFSQTWLWAKSASGTNTDEGYSISADAAGNVFVTGYFSSPTIKFGSTTLINAGGFDVFIAKYDVNGNVLWAKSVGGTDWDEGHSVSANAGGNVYVTGNQQKYYLHENHNYFLWSVSF